ncbi:MAG: hypothetical protein JW900_11650 [Anaerolineae bacterium]|nr:hypothetical protein [Anaerolineae bacterium]
MTESAMPAEIVTQLKTTSHCLHSLIRLRSALAPFRTTLHALGKRGQEPEGRRQLLMLWRPCQEQLDFLLDKACSSQTTRLRLLREELENNLLDETFHAAALDDLAETLEQAGEAMLLEIERDLRLTVARLEEAQAV